VYTITVANAGPSDATGVVIDDSLPSGAAGATWTCTAAPGSSCGAASGSGAISTTVDLSAAGSATFEVTMQAGPVAGTLNNSVQATVPAGIIDPDSSNNSAADTDALVFTADLAVTKTASAPLVAIGQSVTYTVAVANSGPDAASGVTVLDTLPAGLGNPAWTCSATPGSSCVASGTGDISTSVDVASGGSVTFTVTAVATPASAGTIVNTATAVVGPDTIDPDPTNNTASASVAIDPTATLAIEKTASVTAAQPGDTFSYDILVSNAGPARRDGVVISDAVPPGLVAQTWTCAGSGGAVCSASAGSGSPLLTADLPLGGSVAINLVVQVASDASGQIVNVATATSGPNNQETFQSSAIVEVNPIVPPSPSLTLAKTTSTTGYGSVGDVISYVLTATNNGTLDLTNVTITDPVATLVACAPATLAVGASSTCAATHVVTQADLDRGAVVNIATVTGVAPDATVVTSRSATVSVPATRNAGLSLVKSTSATGFTNAGESIVYTVSATNTGNVTLVNVAIADPNAVLTGCPPTTLAPGQSIVCTATHVVTADDLASGVILNQAQATGLPMLLLEGLCDQNATCEGQVPLSALSNTVALNLLATSPNLPTSGNDIVPKLWLATLSFALGMSLMLLGRRRRRPC
jgi:uncharacterized repeat protein (TIGR01451 family)